MTDILPTIVVDNFFETPSLVRDYALGLEFFKGNRGNWPGTRTQFLDKINSELFEVVARNLIVNLNGYTGFSELQASFQLVSEIHGSGWVHTDDTRFNLGVIIFLNPNPPENSGFAIYEPLAKLGDLYWEQHQKLKEEYFSKFKKQVETENADEIKKYVEYRNKHNATYRESIRFQNKFNRALMFSSSQHHAAQNFFGATKEDSRLTLVCFGRAV